MAGLTLARRLTLARGLTLARRLTLGVSVAAILAGPALAQDRLRVGSAVSGELQSADARLGSGEFLDSYVLEGRAGQEVAIRLESPDFDPYLMIRGPGDLSEDNDDSGEGGVDSLLSLRLPADGEYRISATSYEAGETGRYRLSVAAGSAPVVESGADLTPGGALRGSLATGDDTLDSGEFLDTFTVSGRRGQTFTVTLRSSDFDPYVMVRGPGGLEEDNDDSGDRGSRDSRLTFTLPADGDFRISATSFSGGETGAYVLALNQGGAESRQVATDGAGRIQLGDTREGRLAEGDPQLDSGEFLDTYSFTGRRGQRLDLRLTSSAFDPYLAITGPDGFGDFNDDDPDAEGVDSRLRVTLPSDGEYQIAATSYEPGESGGYSLTVDEGGAEAEPDRAPVDLGQGMQIGDTVAGALGGGDATFGSGEYFDVYSFGGRRGERVTIDLASGDFDAYVTLESPSGQQVAVNDDGQSGTDSRIDHVLEEDGDYVIRATSYAADEQGDYRLSLARGREPDRHAAVSGGPRVFAVMVGVADYEGDVNDLPYTDDDAEKLSQALARQGVLNPASVVLTNAGATRAGVQRAFADVAAQAGPEDIFMFFFSGHGIQTETTASREDPDGRMENLALYDGNLSDIEMAELFNTLDTRLALLVIDACFSGGFGRNVVDQPGVMGVFSSEEDLTSSTANKFEAGGFLSHFIRAGVTGEADENSDRLVTAGELATYLRRSFARDVVNVSAETMDGQRNYQNLVIERGGVQIEDVVLRLADGGSAAGGR